jgi:hypothetical protein
MMIPVFWRAGFWRRSIAGCLIAAAFVLQGLAARPTKTRNLVVITLDGLRWQEVFSGAEEALIHPVAGGVVNTNRVRTDFWRPTPAERRSALMPFFWSVIAGQGQLYGNQEAGSVAELTNGRKFTYPGFNEIFAGFADDRINSNAKRPNPNVTFFEWLHRKPEFTNRVVGFVNWDTYPYILNPERSGIPIWSGHTPGVLGKTSERFDLIERLAHDATPFWTDALLDTFFFHAALEHLRENRPRLIWVAAGETDEWAHMGRYDYYLYAAQRQDRHIRRLWESMQAIPEYRGSTTFVLTCDHGRGRGPVEWKNHGAAVEGAEGIWIAVLGPDTPPLGERRSVPIVYQNQIAATACALLGFDYREFEPKAGPVIPELVGR